MKLKLLSLLFILVTLTACGAGNQANQAVPTVVLDGNSSSNSATQAPTKSSSSQFSGGGVTASGIVASMQEAELAFSLAGSVQKVYVKEGNQVKAGDLLAELDNASIQVAVDQAQRNLREMTSQAAIAAAEQAVANNQKTYDDAKKKVDSINNRRTNNVTIQYLQDQLTLAQNALDHARDVYKQTARLSAVDPVRAQA